MMPEDVYQKHKEEVKIIRECMVYAQEFLELPMMGERDKRTMYAFLKFLKRKEDL